MLWGAQFVQQVGLGLIFLAFFSKDLDPGHRVTFGELMNAEEAVEHESPDRDPLTATSDPSTATPIPDRSTATD